MVVHLQDRSSREWGLNGGSGNFLLVPLFSRVVSLKISFSLNTISSRRALGHYSQVARSTTKEALWKRVAVFVVGTMLSLFTTLFLAYLWFSDEQQWVWRRLVETQWLTRTVTLIALFVRLIISMQAAAATSMIAAVFLESHTNLPELASVSIMRFTNTGPSTAIYPILRTAWASPLMATVLVALALTSTALKFTSTVLLSDFDTAAALRTRWVSVCRRTRCAPSTE